jgi:diguanylate cyclase
MFNAHSKLLDKDHRLALLVFFAIVACAAVLPFAIWRFSQGQVVAGTLDLALFGCFAGAAWTAWRRSQITLVARVVSVLITVGCIAVAPVIGGLAALWGYAVLLANLMLSGRKLGFLLNLVLLAGIVVLHSGPTSTLEQVTFVVTGLMVSIFGYVFALVADQQRQRLEALATFDSLTGAGNRRMMEYDLAEAFAHGQRHGVKHGLAVLDIDHFKDVNDSFGHVAGDAVLVSLARLVQDSLRNEDRLYRMGGEEFVLLLPDTNSAGLARTLGRLQERLRSRLAGAGGAVTVSIGASTTREGETNWENWLARADEALYAAKSAGRDQVQIARESGEIRPLRIRRRANDRPEKVALPRLA